MEDRQLEILLRLADEGDAWAKEQLSAIVSGVVDNTYKVLQRDNCKEYYVRQLRARADNGDAEAMGEIGDCCYGVNQDYDEAQSGIGRLRSREIHLPQSGLPNSIIRVDMIRYIKDEQHYTEVVERHREVRPALRPDAKHGTSCGR